jgi:hypothetical protein
LISPPAAIRSLAEVARQLGEAMHLVLAALMLTWLACWVCVRFLRVRPVMENFPVPKRSGAILMLGAAAVTAPMLAGLHANVHYLDHRHAMFLAAMLAPLAGAAVACVAGCAAALMKLIGLGGRLRSAALPAVALSIAAGLAWHALRPLQYDKLPHRRAAEAIAAVARPTDYLLTDSAWILHYSQVPGTRLYLAGATGEDLLAHAARSRATLVALSRRGLAKARGPLLDALKPPRFVELSNPQDEIRVFRAAPAGGP